MDTVVENLTIQQVMQLIAHDGQLLTDCQGVYLLFVVIVFMCHLLNIPSYDVFLSECDRSLHPLFVFTIKI